MGRGWRSLGVEESELDRDLERSGQEDELRWLWHATDLEDRVGIGLCLLEHEKMKCSFSHY